MPLNGKYQSRLRFHTVRAQRWLLRSVLRTLADWRPLPEAQDGYTILIGCSSQLARMLLTNLLLLSRQRRGNLRKIVVIFDRPSDQIGTPIERAAREAFPDLPLQFVYYTPLQAKVLGAIGWGWAYAWLSWCLGIAQAQTRYAFLQDYDAYLLQPDVIETRYDRIRRAGVEYFGSRWYAGNGVIREDRLVATPELMFDAQFVRSRFRPIDLFNHVCKYNGRTVDFDTFLYAQSLAGRGEVEHIPEEWMVHPSQLICQFTAHANDRRYVPPVGNNLLLIPYFMFLAGDQDQMERQRDALPASRDASVPFAGRPMNVTNLHRKHVDWITKQAFRLEHAVAGHVRPAVADYFDAIAAYVDRKDDAPALRPMEQAV
jgi:hypothetical protein